MLVFNRVEGESFVIGDDVMVSILKKSGRRVSIGVTADQSIPVKRTELLTEAERERIARKLNIKEKHLEKRKN